MRSQLIVIPAATAVRGDRTLTYVLDFFSTHPLYNSMSSACSPYFWTCMTASSDWLPRLQRETTPKITVFIKIVFCNSFWLKTVTTFILPASYSSRRNASNELYVDLETSFWKFDLRSRSWPWWTGSCCISLDPYRRAEHIWRVFTALASLYQKV